MRRRFATLILVLLGTGFLRAADSAGQVAEAIAKLKSATNYSWTTTLEMPDMPFTPSPVRGEAEKDGIAILTQTTEESTNIVVFKGDRIAVKVGDDWELMGEGRSLDMIMGATLARNGSAADEAAAILKTASVLKTDENGVIIGELTPESAADLLAFGPRSANGRNGYPRARDAKGSIKFWLKDGALVKFQSHLHGTVTFGEGENELDLTRTVEIANVNATKFEAPPDAIKKIEAGPRVAPGAK